MRYEGKWISFEDAFAEWGLVIPMWYTEFFDIPSLPSTHPEYEWSISEVEKVIERTIDRMLRKLARESETFRSGECAQCGMMKRAFVERDEYYAFRIWPHYHGPSQPCRQFLFSDLARDYRKEKPA